MCETVLPHLFHQERKRSFFRCATCEMVFVPEDEHVSPEVEKARYDLHQNSLENEGYRTFLSQIITPLQARIPPGSQGLDFGSGPSPVLAMLLREKGFNTECYDPFYHDRPDLLSRQYDFVTSTEVVEHFRSPRKDWAQLTGLVQAGGWLAVMTQTIPEEMTFDRWYYQRDTTHICFYTRNTFNWIANKYQLFVEQHGPSIALFQRPVKH